ncbi:endonuclease/exonuclease/phosphatase family protein [Actinomycetospora termitidis]|uniref:Endonuclease/exonuclease/phosphatase family protein n=1 Tax=Actinomycetospora termitidis TaxID=3053470 RepID=A0ABT7MCL4_9PSEU|nr:endonuclease/exonuclease/phosphatase family protein [Actinomycetospora sp. Odt1-22]MDL5158423.1 endonuclease/exonuclease/phosphatase family protein [Actinomycetospora sp. Odt1-22]
MLVLLLLAACTPTAERPASLRVMTWNVLTSRHDPADWAPTIAAARPDVVGLQEICAVEAGELADLLGREHGLDYVAVPGPVVPTPAEDAAPVNAALRRPCADRGPVTYGLAMLVRRPVVAATVQLFAPDRRDEQRGYQRVDLGSFVVLNAHLGLNGVAGAQQAALAAAVDGRPTVVLGDLNSVDVGPLGSLTSVGSFPTTGAGAIDHVLVRGFGVVSADAPPVTVSDHRPIVADLAGP